MIKIRKNVFETNSSSTHSIAIPKAQERTYPSEINFYIGEYGWDFESVNPASYLYTAILMCYDDKKGEEILGHIKNVLDEHHIKYTFEKPILSRYGGWLEFGELDHPENLDEFLKVVLGDDKKLLDFIFYGLVFTGNDNCDFDGRAFVNRNKPKLKDWEWCDGKLKQITKENPYYESNYENYDWYYKGN